MIPDLRYHDAILEVVDELKMLKAKVDDPNHPFADLHSPHHGYALLLEEMDELWDEVKKKNIARNPWAMREEAMQIAALAIRFMVDLT